MADRESHLLEYHVQEYPLREYHSDFPELEHGQSLHRMPSWTILPYHWRKHIQPVPSSEMHA